MLSLGLFIALCGALAGNFVDPYIDDVWKVRAVGIAVAGGMVIALFGLVHKWLT